MYWKIAAPALILLSLTGCDQIDPLTKPYAWKPSDANAFNIAAQAANPADLVTGRPLPRRSRATLAAMAAERVWAGKPVALLGGGTASGGGEGGGAGGGSAGGGK